MKYNKEKTLKHEIADNFENCVKILDELIEDEGYSGPLPIFDVEVEVIDMDCVELISASNQGRDQNKSMDCAFIISDHQNDKVVFAEFRFNYENLANLNRKSLIGKVTGSTAIIGGSVPVLQEYAFIFESSLLQQARSRLSRMNPVIPNNYKAFDVEGLKHKYF